MEVWATEGIVCPFYLGAYSAECSKSFRGGMCVYVMFCWRLSDRRVKPFLFFTNLNVELSLEHSLNSYAVHEGAYRERGLYKQNLAHDGWFTRFDEIRQTRIRN